ncbi:hypothetical protein LXL04_017113 [Taraxacum kok-saghyz]
MASTDDIYYALVLPSAKNNFAITHISNSRNLQQGIENVELRDGYEHGDAIVEPLDCGERVYGRGDGVLDGEIVEVEVPLMVVDLLNDAVEGTLIELNLSHVTPTPSPPASISSFVVVQS